MEKSESDFWIDFSKKENVFDTDPPLIIASGSAENRMDLMTSPK